MRFTSGKLCLLLLLFPMAEASQAGQSRFVTISIPSTNAPNFFSIQEFETARLVSASDPLGLFTLTISKQYGTNATPNITTLSTSDLQGYSGNNGYTAPKPCVITGPATLTLLNTGNPSRTSTSAAFATFEILPAYSDVNQTEILPPSPNKVFVTLESSTNLVQWSDATNGVYGSPDSARFFASVWKRWRRLKASSTSSPPPPAPSSPPGNAKHPPHHRRPLLPRPRPPSAHPRAGLDHVGAPAASRSVVRTAGE